MRVVNESMLFSQMCVCLCFVPSRFCLWCDQCEWQTSAVGFSVVDDKFTTINILFSQAAMFIRLKFIMTRGECIFATQYGIFELLLVSLLIFVSTVRFNV